MSGVELDLSEKETRNWIIDPQLKRVEWIVRLTPATSRHHDIENPNWTFFGTGSSGAKAECLHNQSTIIRSCGFVEEPRIVLNMGFFQTGEDEMTLTRKSGMLVI